MVDEAQRVQPGKREGSKSPGGSIIAAGKPCSARKGEEDREAVAVEAWMRLG